MASDSSNKNNYTVNSLSLQFWKREIVDDLFQAMQNIVAGTANVSKKILNETCLEWIIEFSPNLPIIILQYELKRDEHTGVRLIPAIHYKVNDENIGNVDDKNTINRENIITVDERRGNSSLLLNFKQEIPELLLSQNNSEEIKDRPITIQDHQLKATSPKMNISTGSTSHSMNNFSGSVISSSGGELIAVTSSDLCMVILQTEEKEQGNCDDERQNKGSEGIGSDIGIGRKKEKVFSRYSLKEKHKKNHTKEKSCTSGENLVHHVSSSLVDTGEKFFTCEICGKFFTSTRSLKCHKKIHTGENPFKCEFCGKSFIYSSYLSRHKRIHTGEKPFTCQVCGKSFMTSSEVIRHHRIHTGEKPFKCNLCNKSFAVSSNLTSHQRIHTGVKPFHCGACGKGFHRKSHLLKHKKRHSE